MKTYLKLLIAASIASAALSCSKNDETSIQTPEQYDVNTASFICGINNRFFSMTPGSTYHYRNQAIQGQDTVTRYIDVTVTHKTKIIRGVTCQAVHYVVKMRTNIVENTMVWYAQDKDGNVWRFGENIEKIRKEVVSNRKGSWNAGIFRAKPGIVMYAHPEQNINKTYREGYLKGVAEDKAIIRSTTSAANVAYGLFHNCVETKEFSDLKPGFSAHKIYADGVGLVLTIVSEGGNEREELISISH